MIDPAFPSFVSPVAASRHRQARRCALLAVLGIALLAAPGTVQAQGRAGNDLAQRSDPPETAVANPSEVVAAERAFERAAQEKGQWSAFAEFAAADAVMFVPQAVNAQDWLRDRPNPPRSVRWQPHQVWMSCDGSLAVTRGGWNRPDGSVGYFTTVWALRTDQDRGYRWVLDQGDALAAPLAAPEAVEEIVGDCRSAGTQGLSEAGLAERDAEALRAGATRAGSGWSADGTLAYRYSVQPSGAREFVVLLVRDGRVEEVVRSEVAAR